MKFFLYALLAAQIFLSSTAWAMERSVTLDIENMTCPLCPITVSKAIKSVDGVTSVEVDMDKGTASVIYDDATATASQIADASTNAGYPAAPKKAK